MHKEGNRTVESAVEARGGLLGRPVLLVLVVSIILALAAMALSYAGFLEQHSWSLFNWIARPTFGH